MREKALLGSAGLTVSCLVCALGFSGCASSSAPPPAYATSTLTSAASTAGVQHTPAESVHLTEGRGLTPVALESGLDVWDRCAYPREAFEKQVDRAEVPLRVHVAADGTPERVEILRDPGAGFADAARDCAMKQLYAPARDGEGNAIAGQTRRIVARFMR
jgi:protein TonB